MSLNAIPVTPEYQHAVANAYARFESNDTISQYDKEQVLEFLQVAVAEADEQVSMSERLTLADAAIEQKDMSGTEIARIRGRNILYFGHFDLTDQ